MLYNLAWIAGVDYCNNPENDNNNNNDPDDPDNKDKLHPNKIAGLAQDHQQKVNQEVNTQDQEVNNQDQDQEEDHKSRIEI
jgi:hypothetical protein